MQQSQQSKNAFLHCFHYQFLKFALETQRKAYAVPSIFEICSRNANKGICSIRKCSTCRKNAFLHCFHHQFLKTSLETQIKAYAVIVNVKHAEKRNLASFSLTNFEISSRNVNKRKCSSRKRSTCRKTRFHTVFIINFSNLF